MQASALSPEERAEKLEGYEKFVHEVLKVQLEQAVQARDQVYQQQSDYAEVAKNIRMIQENDLRTMKTMVTLGSDVYVHAKVPDTSYIFVNVGLGVQAQFTLDEALEFIAVKEAALSERGRELTEDANKIKARIKLIYEAMHQLMGMEGRSKPARPEAFY